MNLFINDIKKPGIYLKKQKAILFGVLFILLLFTLLTSSTTSFSLVKAISAVPKVVVWAFSNLIPNQEAMKKYPKIMDKLLDTLLMSVMASMTASFFGLIFALFGARTTSPNNFLAALSRTIASVSRNIPVAAWAMILLLTFGQSTFTGFLALFFASFGFLTRVFMETIDEASSKPVQALKAAGANNLQIIVQAVLPSSLPQILSWILYMIETNIRSATLVGLLTGSGIGFIFSLYYKSLQYQAASLVVISIVVVILIIEILSNALRRIIL